MTSSSMNLIFEKNFCHFLKLFLLLITPNNNENFSGEKNMKFSFQDH